MSFILLEYVPVEWISWSHNCTIVIFLNAIFLMMHTQSISWSPQDEMSHLGHHKESFLDSFKSLSSFLTHWQLQYVSDASMELQDDRKPSEQHRMRRCFSFNSHIALGEVQVSKLMMTKELSGGSFLDWTLESLIKNVIIHSCWSYCWILTIYSVHSWQVLKYSCDSALLSPVVSCSCFILNKNFSS